MRFPFFLLSCTVFFLLCTQIALAGTDSRLYVRGGTGWGWSENARFADVDCTGKHPPALFGCQPGRDGQPIGARGDFGNSALVLAGIGYRLLPWLRSELSVNYKPDLAFDGQANFLHLKGAQPVHGNLDSISFFLSGFVDLPTLGPLQPFLGLGGGIARNAIGDVTYGFPELGPRARTRVAGGTETNFAWFAGAGVSVALSAVIKLDIGYRYTDLGKVRTDASRATIVRPGSKTFLDVGATQANLTTNEIVLSLRYLL